MKFVRAMILAFAVLVAAPMGVALAQYEEHAENAAESRAASFEAARGAQVEQVPGGTLLIAAYGAIWILLLGYVVSIGFRQARTARELDQLRHDLEARSGKAKSEG